MSKTDFFKVNAEGEQNALLRIGEKSYLLIYGYRKDNEDDEQGYNWRKYYDHNPSAEELKEDIVNLIDSETDGKILSGFVWKEIPVYLSTENQMNFKAAYDLAVQTSGATLPIKFKLGEDTSGNALYHTFSELTEFTDFYTKAMGYVISVLNAGWEEKDNIQFDKLVINE